jgi:hypothetical protein
MAGGCNASFIWVVSFHKKLKTLEIFADTDEMHGLRMSAAGHGRNAWFCACLPPVNPRNSLAKHRLQLPFAQKADMADMRPAVQKSPPSQLWVF